MLQQSKNADNCLSPYKEAYIKEKCINQIKLIRMRVKKVKQKSRKEEKNYL